MSLLSYQASGDAFGAPFEFHQDAFELALQSVEENRFLDAIRDCASPRFRGRKPGLYTDDTQQGLLLCWIWDNLLARGKDPRNAAHVAQVFTTVCYTMQSHRVKHPNAFGIHRGTGKNFRECVQKGKPVHTPGLGAVMRIAPVVCQLGELADVTPWVATLSRATTTHPVGLYSACAFAEHVWSLYHTSKSHIHPLISRGMDILDNQGHDACVQYVKDTWHPDEDIKGMAYGYGPSGVIWSIYIAMNATSFEQAMVDACSYGGDTDTICSMVACVMGARGGFTIPDWMKVELDPNWHPIHTEKRLTIEEASYLDIHP